MPKSYDYVPTRYDYVQTCSRCRGSGFDPDCPELYCDCCNHGQETLRLSEAEAVHYPNAKRVQ